MHTHIEAPTACWDAQRQCSKCMVMKKPPSPPHTVSPLLANLATRALGSAKATVSKHQQARGCRHKNAVQLQKLGSQRMQHPQRDDYWKLCVSAIASAYRQMQEWLVYGKSTNGKGK